MAIITARALLINKENKLLMVSHKGEEFYYTPGGRWHEGESLIDCVKREVYEETGLKAEVDKLIYVNEFTGSDGNKHIAFFFFGRVDQELPEAWEDLAGDAPIVAKFLSEEELKNADEAFPAFLKDQFWRDLNNDFVNSEIYKLGV